MEDRELKEYQRTLEIGIGEFRERCLFEAKKWNKEFDEAQFLEFLNIIFSESLLKDWFCHTYPIGRTFLRPPLRMPREAVNKFRSRLIELASSHYLCASVLSDAFELILLVDLKKLHGDTRNYDMLIAESKIIEHRIKGQNKTTYYQAQKRLPVAHDYIYEVVRYNTARGTFLVECEHFFGTPKSEEGFYKGCATEYMILYRSEKDSILPNIIDSEHGYAIHPEPLPVNLKPQQLPKLCQIKKEEALHLGRAYAGLMQKVSNKLEGLYEYKISRGVNEFVPYADVPSHYPKYQSLMTKPDEASTVVVAEFPQVIQKIRDKYLKGEYSAEEIPGKIAVSLKRSSKNKIVSELGRRRTSKDKIDWQQFDDKLDEYLELNDHKIPKFKTVKDVLRWWHDHCPWELVCKSATFVPRFAKDAKRKPTTPTWWDLWGSIGWNLDKLSQEEQHEIVRFLTEPGVNLGMNLTRKIGRLLKPMFEEWEKCKEDNFFTP